MASENKGWGEGKVVVMTVCSSGCRERNPGPHVSIRFLSSGSILMMSCDSLDSEHIVGTSSLQ